MKTEAMKSEAIDAFTALKDRIERLGDRLEAAYRRCHYNDAELPALAGDLLAGFEAEAGFDPRSIAAFFASSRVPQQTQLRFSDLPLTLYRHREFYIEILVWSHSSTAVHQHSFAGAFKVLRGSSLHTTFSFEQQRRLSADCLLGDVRPEHTEYLALGAVRPILAGEGGLIHSLYHLEQPSMTLVVRSHGHELHQPQYSYYRPGIALNPFHYEKDDLLIMTSRLLDVTQQVDAGAGLPLWLDSVERLDYPRLVYLLLTKRYLLSSDADLQQVLEAARDRHGDLVDPLTNSLRVQRKQETLGNCRQDLQDPDLRFLLALLMNATDRDSVLRLLKLRHPDADPVHTCAALLARLSTSKAEMNRRLAQALAEANSHALLLGSRLGVALPDQASAEDAELLYRAFLKDPSEPDHDVKVKLDSVQVQKFIERLQDQESLECLR